MIIFNEISKDTKIEWNMKHNQSISLRLCLYKFFHFEDSMNFFEIGYKNYQNK
jgi:hypothetical protein